ncbi:MAG: hypothetical protein WC365_08100 [Candidatus Babeliales bacterium]|jgi:ABC-type Zn uptake system ZnuABC Zn-binding protein ZnuA
MTIIEITQIETETVVEASSIQALIDAAIEHNIAYLLQQHSNPTKLMNILRNTAIDNAFIEVTQRLDDIETAHDISMSNVTATLLNMQLKIKKLEDAQQ